MKISVLTPSYNTGNYIEKAIKSVLAQNYNNFEHIIVDGVSQDNTIDVLRKYTHLNWISEPDKGQSDAMNKAFNLSTGDIIVYLNADDELMPNVFEYIISCFKVNSHTDIIVGNIKNTFENNRLPHIQKPSFHFKQIILPFLYTFPINPVGYFYKRSVQEQVGLFPLNEHFAMDYWFLIRAFNKFKVIKTNKVFGVFFHSGINKTSTVNCKKETFRIAQDFVKTKSIFLKIYFWINYLYYLLLIIPLKNYKLPFKWIYYCLFAYKHFSSYTEFSEVGVKKFRKS